MCKFVHKCLDMYTIKQVAENLNLSQKTIRRYLHSGMLECFKVGGTYRISKEQLDNFLNKKLDDLPTFSKGIGKSKSNDEVNWIDISEDWEQQLSHNLTSVDLFCGAGGMTKGFELAGFNPLAGLDWFKQAGDTYSKNFSHPFFLGDITQQSVKNDFISLVKSRLGGKELTVLSGGFPCQGFSLSGNRIVEDPRNSLYKDMLDIIEALNPQYIVAENVKGLRSMHNGKIEQKIIEDINKLGYDVNVTVLTAADYYVPQKRERVIFIGNRIGAPNLHPAPMIEPASYVTTKEAIEDLLNVPDSKSFNHVRTKHSDEMKSRLRNVDEGKSLYDNYSDSWKKCPWNDASCTIKENHGGVNIHPRDSRVITVREMARLQSFPDDFIFEGSKGKQMVQIGNAVPPFLAKAIGLAIRKSVSSIIQKD